MRSGTESPDADLRDGLPMETWNDQVQESSVSVSGVYECCLKRKF
jgi:hypothetical protein